MIILFYVIYELLYPVVNQKWLHDRLQEDYLKRYNKGEYYRIKMKSKSEEGGITKGKAESKSQNYDQKK